MRYDSWRLFQHTEWWWGANVPLAVTSKNFPRWWKYRGHIVFEEVFSYEHEPANYMSDLIMKIFPVSNVCEALWYLICLRRIWKPCISTALSFMHNYEVSGFTTGWNWRHRWERHQVFRRNTKECKSGFWRLDTDWTGRIWKDEDWNPSVNFFFF